MPKYFIKATGFKQYKSDVIESARPEFALAEYRSALEGGHVEVESEEFEIEIDEEVEDESTI